MQNQEPIPDTADHFRAAPQLQAADATGDTDGAHAPQLSTGLAYSALQQSKQPIFVLSIDYPSMIIRFVNPAFTSAADLNASDVVSHQIKDFLSPTSYEALLEHVQAAIEFGESLAIPAIYFKRADQWWVCSGHLSLTATGGTSYVGIVLLEDLMISENYEWEWQEVLTSANSLFWRGTVTKVNYWLDWSVYIPNPDAAHRWMPISMQPGDTFGVAWDRARDNDDNARMYLTSSQAIEGGAPGYEQEFRTILPDGSIRWVSENARITRISDNQWRIVAMCSDITGLKRQQEALSRESSLLNALMDHVPDNVYIKDRDSRFLRVSQSMAAGTLGLENPQDAVGKTDFDFFSPDHAVPAFEDDAVVMRSRQPIINKVEFETSSDGLTRWISTTKAPVFNELGEVLGTVGVSRDITQTLKEEQDRKRAEAESKALIASARCLVWNSRVSRIGDDFHWKLLITDTESAVRWFPIGILPGQPLEEAWMASVLPEDMMENRAQAIHAMKNGLDGYKLEFRIALASGQIRWLSEHVSVDTVAENEWDLVGVCTDITEQKVADLELKHLVSSARCVLWHANVEEHGGELKWDLHFSDEVMAHKWFPIKIWPDIPFGWSWGRSIARDDFHRMAITARDAIRAGQDGYQQEFRVALQDGRTTWIAEQVRIEQIADDRWRLVGACMDITDQKVVETELRHLITNLQCMVWHGLVHEVEDGMIWDTTVANEEAASRWLQLDTEGYADFSAAFYSSRTDAENERLIELTNKALRNGSPSYQSEYRCRQVTGEYRWISETVQIEHLSKTHWHLVGVCSDVTAYKEAEAALAHERNMLRTVIDNVPDAIYAKDDSLHFILSNVGHRLLLGIDQNSNCIGKDDQDFFPPQLSQRYRSDEISILNSGVSMISVEEPSERIDGTPCWNSTTKVPLRSDNGDIIGIVGISRDITMAKTIEHERERMLAEALERADRDPLTGLLNHRAFHKRLEEEANRATRQGTSLAVAVMDLDNFKFFNDAYGHSVGDEVLCQVARGLKNSCRTYDILARFGGDEFALLMPGSGRVEAEQMAERLRYCLDGLGYTPPGYDVAIPLSVSVGMSVFPIDADTRHSALALADERLMRSKTGGDDRADISERMRHELMASSPNFSMLNALVSAVDNKDRYTRRHSDDVLEYSLMIARELGMDDAALHTVQVAALLHDVGKIGVPDSILRKPGVLSVEEYSAIKQHPTMGAVIVGAVAGFEPTLDAVRHHHERWDGLGYPMGLKGEETPLIARLMAVADAFSAMTTDRPYRKGLPPLKALRILKEGAGTQWDPACVEAFVRARRRAGREVPA